MSEDADDDDIEKPAGLPGWMATFADMMALLMCFFVLLLAYSEMNVEKFKQVAGAMRNAFGIQTEMPATQIPSGDNPIFEAPTSGNPDNVITVSADRSAEDLPELFDRETWEKLREQALLEEAEEKASRWDESNKALQTYLQQALVEELQSGVLELEVAGQQVTIRIRENGSFSSASAFLQPRFKPVVLRITRLLNNIPGAIAVDGHTDNQPVNPDIFESNWDLSAERAVAVAQQMLRVDDFDTARLTVTGHASNKPLIDRDTRAARQANRRVEIVITQGKPMSLGELEILKQAQEIQ